ncbi:MAG: hypothetical protein AAF517_22990, partial [Planctomycetota bacterium]
EDAALAGLIAGSSGNTVVQPVKFDKKLESSYQNLASRNEGVRTRARAALVAAGAGVKAELEKRAETDARRKDEVAKVLKELESAAKVDAASSDLIQQFAIRLAAEREAKSLRPAIQKVASDAKENFFVRLAAEDALARMVEGHTSALKLEVSSGKKQLKSLPLKTNVVLDSNLLPAKPGKGGGLTIQKAMSGVGGIIGAPPGQQVAMARQGLIDFVKQYGNIRVERAQVLHVGKTTQTSGGLGVMVRGHYDRPVLEATLGSSPLWTKSDVSGYPMYSSPFLRLVLMDDHSALVLPILASATFPIQKYLADVKAGREVLGLKTEWKNFFTSIEGNAPMRARIVTNEELLGPLLAELGTAPPPIAEGIKNLELIHIAVSRNDNNHGDLRVTADFAKESAASTFAEFLNQSINEFKVQLDALSGAEGVPPAISEMAETVKSLTVESKGKKGVLKMNLPKGSIADIFTATTGVNRVVEE